MRPALPIGWIEFAQPGGAFTVFLPAQAYPSDRVDDLRLPVPVGQLRQAQYACQVPGWFCEVGVKIYSPELVAANRSHSETSPLIAGRTRTAATWLGRPAFDVTTEDPEHHGVHIYRRAWIGNRVYHCSVSGHPTASELAALFDSFTPAK